MRNMPILQEVLEMSTTTVHAELNAMLHVCERDLQDVLTDCSNFMLNVCFQFLYSAWLVDITAYNISLEKKLKYLFRYLNDKNNNFSRFINCFLRANDEISIKMSKNIGHTGL
jgi:hypothetical protein